MYSSQIGANAGIIGMTKEHLVQKRLQDRIADNCGETIYEIGVGEGEFFPKMTGCFQKHHS